MMSLEEIAEEIESVFHNSNFRIAGLCQKTQTRDGKLALRKVNEIGSSYMPVTYDGRDLFIFMLKDPIEINSARTGIVTVELYLLSQYYDKHKDLVDLFDESYFENIRLYQDSLSIYNNLFEDVEDKPFTDYAFMVEFEIACDYKNICCGEIENKLC